MQSEGNTFWFKGWLPNGVPGSFTLAINPEYAFEEAMEFTNALLAKGVTLHEPGLEPGQKREAISQVVMGRKTDGTLWADLYSAKAQLENRMVRCYFDADKADVADTFQQASGYSLNQNHKFWIGDAPVRRGKNIDADAYLITLPRPVNAILYQNPDFVEPPEGQMPKMAKWKVSHFEPTTDTPTPAPAGNPYATKPDAPLATTILIREGKDKKPYLTVLAANNQPLGVTPTRKIFTDAGYDTNAWTGINSRHELNPPAVVTTEIVSNSITVTSVAKAA
jgi:hypothetical protein